MSMFNIANKYDAGHIGPIDNYKAYIWCLRTKKHVEAINSKLRTLTAQCPAFVKTQLNESELAEGINEAEKWSAQ